MKKPKYAIDRIQKYIGQAASSSLECTSHLFIKIPCTGSWFEPKVPEILLEGNKDGDSNVL